MCSLTIGQSVCTSIVRTIQKTCQTRHNHYGLQRHSLPIGGALFTTTCKMTTDGYRVLVVLDH